MHRTYDEHLRHEHRQQDCLLQGGLGIRQFRDVVESDIRVLVDHVPLQHADQVCVGTLSIRVAMVQEGVLPSTLKTDYVSPDCPFTSSLPRLGFFVSGTCHGFG